MLANLEITLVLRIQEVADLLVVDFDVRDLDCELHVGVGGCFLCEANKEFGTGEGNNALVGAIWTCASISGSGCAGATGALTYIPSY